MAELARGTFDVKITPHMPSDSSKISRMALRKQFHGDLEGTSDGEMLAAGTDTKGSAGYVAIEQVTGSIHGRNGSFILQHSGTMSRGTPSLTVSVVPDSGVGELVGLSGSLTITIADGKHFYDLHYTLGGVS